MKDRWEKGDPVNLSDLLKITPVANEIMRLAQELNMKFPDIMWIVTEIIRDYDYDLESGQESPQVDFDLENDETELFDEDWEREEEKDETNYRVFLKVESKGKFPEISFKAGIHEREDLKGFLNMVIEIMGKMDI
jgi:hypothetical protein